MGVRASCRGGGGVTVVGSAVRRVGVDVDDVDVVVGRFQGGGLEVHWVWTELNVRRWWVENVDAARVGSWKREIRCKDSKELWGEVACGGTAVLDDGTMLGSS